MIFLGHSRIMNTVWKQATGLMLRWPNKPFLFEFPLRRPRKIGITMFLVFYPIDVLLVRNNVVVDVVHFLQPFSFYRSKKIIDMFIEIPAGTIQQKSLQIGMSIHRTKNTIYLANLP